MIAALVVADKLSHLGCLVLFIFPLNQKKKKKKGFDVKTDPKQPPKKIIIKNHMTLTNSGSNETTTNT